jgi:hypothetical protein
MKNAVFFPLGFAWLLILSSYNTGPLFGYSLNKKAVSRAVLYLFVITFFIIYYFFFSSPMLIFAASTQRLIWYACNNTPPANCQNSRCNCSTEYDSWVNGSGIAACNVSCNLGTVPSKDCGATGCEYINNTCLPSGTCIDLKEDNSGDKEYCASGNDWQDVDWQLLTSVCDTCVASGRTQIDGVNFPCGTLAGCTGTNLDGGNEAIQPKCCGDDTGENYRTCNGTINGGSCDSSKACCDASTDCAWISNCSSSSRCVTTGSFKSYCNSTGNWSDPDFSSTACTATGCAFSWNSSVIKWEPATNASCCGDDTSENSISCAGTINGGSCDSNKACCDASTDCEYNNNCYATGGCNATGSYKSYCNSGSWNDPDASSTACTATGCAFSWNSSVIKWEPATNASCCGDDTSEYPTERICTSGVCTSDSTKMACCDVNTDCAYSIGGSCYSTGSSSDVDSDGWQEKCSSGTWVDGASPRFSLNNTNVTSICPGDPVLFYANWTDDIGLSGYIFQFCNGTWNGTNCLGVPSSWSSSLTGWQYRKSHNITNSTGADVNYTVNITVVNGTGTDSGNTVYIYNKTRSDFGDIRFTNSTGSLLNYWIESVNSGANATFWIQIDGNLTSANQTIYIYYGNPSATNISNGTNTFPFFDDFPGTSIDTTKWDTYGTGTYSVANSILTLTYSASCPGGDGTCEWERVQSKTGFDINYALHVRFRTDNPADYNRPDYIYWINPTTGEMSGPGFGYYKNDYHNRFWEESNGTSGNSVDKGAMTDTNYHIIDVGRESATSIRCSYDYTYENQLNTYITGGTKYVSIQVGHAAWSGYSHNGLTDWVVVRKYFSPEPSHGAWGSEEYIFPNSISCGSLSLGQSCQLNWTVKIIEYFFTDQIPCFYSCH